jgi:hypothetical protein
MMGAPEEHRLFREPRWLIPFFTFWARLPFRSWPLAAFLVLAIAAVNHWVGWANGSLRGGQIYLYFASLGFYFVLMPFYWILIARRARTGLRRFFRESGKSEAQVSEAIEDFNSVPGRLAPVLVVLGIFAGYLMFRIVGREVFPLSGAVLPWLSALTYMYTTAWGGLLFARAIRQSILIHRLYEEVDVTPFRPSRIYALSGYATFTAFMLFLLLYGLNLLSIPEFIVTPWGVGTQTLFFMVISLLFVVPLSGINRRMRAAKDRLLDAVNADLDHLNLRIHAAAEAEEYARLAQLRDALGTLRDSRDLIRAIPTWPWPPNTVRNAVAPLLLPTVIFLVQLLIERLVGR